MQGPPDERMSDLEHLMWRLDRDPVLATPFANLSLLDQAPDLDELRRRMSAGAKAVPRLCQRVVESPGGIAPPVWRYDIEFDVDDHIDVIQAPNGCTMEQLCELAEAIAAKPFDPAHSPWRFTVILGLPDDRAAMVQQFHHAVTDGEGGIKMSMQYMDLERHPERPAYQAAARAAHPAGGGGKFPGQQWISDAADAATHTARTVWDRAVGAVGSAANLALNPLSIADTAADLVGLVTSFGRQARAVDQQTTSLWNQRSATRSFATAEIALDRLLGAARAHGVHLNDVFVSASVEAATRFHRERNAALSEIRVSIPVSTRHGRAGGNLFAPTVELVPAEAEPDMWERAAKVNRLMETVKSERTLDMIEPLAGAVNLMPMPVVQQAGRWVTSRVDLVCSNVRAAPFGLFIAGSLVEANYPVGPMAGAAVNVTLMSYRGVATIGVRVDAEAVGAAQPFAEILQAVLDEL